MVKSNGLLRPANLLAVIISVAIAGCAAVDRSLTPRGQDVNLSAGDLRDNAVLLNIVRASLKEPLDFVAISKYTATSSLGVTSNLLTRAGGTSSSIPQATFGPNNLAALAGNTFDLGTLENHDFYVGMMSPVSPVELHLILHSGLSRPLIFHALLDGVVVTLEDGKTLKFSNDPTQYSWTYTTAVKEPRSPRCEELATKYTESAGSGFNRPFTSPVWNGIHEHDCQYQKFEYFLGLALIYGVTTQATTKPNPAAKTDKTQPATITQAQLCFDPSLAQNRINSKNLICGSLEKRGAGEFVFYGSGRIKTIQPLWRSPYSIFRYFGSLLTIGPAAAVVRIDAGVPMLRTQGDQNILTIVTAPGLTGCFAYVHYDGVSYCVPSRGAENTKEIFTLLSTLVALSTTQSALPVTPTVTLAP